MVIVITGIIGGMVAVFLKAPIQQYMDVSRRADMTDIADTAVRRVVRDLRLALPNSVRVTGACDGVGDCFIEFLPTTSGGRYRAVADAGVLCAAVPGNAAGDALSFVAADTCFEVLGPLPTVAVGDQVVVYNLGSAGADAYAGNTLATHNRRAVSAVGANTISITSANALPFDSPGNRFHVITTPVSYVCDGAGALLRWQGYAIQAAQPTTLPITGSSVRLATHVSGCRFDYNANVVAQRSGLVTMHLGITEQGETVSLYSAAHVSNQP
ncbi:MAG: hypothetical protein IPM27_09545 [Nitrosomonadales bacterium]|nr:hypothetical protein [Nitrosomonadales bacterium]